MNSAAASAGPKTIDWGNIAFLAMTPLVAVLGTSWYAYHHGVTWLELANFHLA